jgi:hypothetical protein
MGSIAELWTKDMWMITAGSLAGADIAQTSGLAARGPWLGALEFHPAHLVGPHTYPHVQLMIRAGLHYTAKFYFPPTWLINLFR